MGLSWVEGRLKVELIEAATDLATANKYVTSYKYHNLEVSPALATGILYLDDDSKTVQWQCGAHITPWHGPWTFEDKFFKVWFDPNAGKPDLWQHGGIRLKSTCVLKTARVGSPQLHLYEGRDYRLREVQITPLALWVLKEGSDTWERIADYSEISHEWILLEDRFYYGML